MMWSRTLITYDVHVNLLLWRQSESNVHGSKKIKVTSRHVKKKCMFPQRRRSQNRSPCVSTCLYNASNSEISMIPRKISHRIPGLKKHASPCVCHRCPTLSRWLPSRRHIWNASLRLWAVLTAAWERFDTWLDCKSSTDGDESQPCNDEIKFYKRKTQCLVKNTVIVRHTCLWNSLFIHQPLIAYMPILSPHRTWDGGRRKRRYHI